jgi:hypothetical protein
VRPQISGDGLHTPAFGVQRDHGPPALGGLRDLVVGREAAHEAQREGLLGEHTLDRLADGPPAEADVAGVRDFVRVEVRVLGLQVHDETADGGKPRRLAASEPKRLSIPSASKRTTLRCSVRSEVAPVSFARSEAGLPNSTEGRVSS